MRVVYIADDGKEFDDEFDCKDYEWGLNHPHLKDIHIYDENNKEMENIFLDDTYNRAAKIIVQNNNAVKDLQELARHIGFCCYEDITECGEWIFSDDKGTFIKNN